MPTGVTLDYSTGIFTHVSVPSFVLHAWQNFIYFTAITPNVAVDWATLPFLIREIRVQISTRTLVILNKILRGLPHSLQRNIIMEPRIKLRPLSSALFPIQSTQVIIL
jgi:hypothetical protein